MKNRLLVTSLLLCISYFVSAQNFSGLQYKRLNRIDDVSTLLETGITQLFGGKINGSVDSVTVTHDAEKTLKVKVYYSGFTNGYFTVTTMNAAKQKQNEVTPAKTTQLASASPFEITLPLAASVAKGSKVESPYLRIDVGKKENGSGNISVFGLNKQWRNELDAQNVIISVALQPVGKAGSLTNQVRDVMPDKTIRFDPNMIQKVQPIRVRNLQRINTPGGNAYHGTFKWADLNTFDDISGTWINTNGGTESGLVKLVVTGNNQIQAWSKCNPTDCDLGKVALQDLGGNNFKAVFGSKFSTSTLNIAYAASQLTVTHVTNNRLVRIGGAGGTSNSSKTYTFKKNIQLIAVTPQIYSIKNMPVIHTIAGNTSTTPQGPNKNFQISLIDEISIDPQVDFKNLQDISRISLRAFPDKNPNAGIYYIMPADYHLKWETKTDAAKGYDFRILYGTQGAPTEDGSPDAPVRMSATLTTGISTREMNFIRTILRASDPRFKAVQYLPLRENPEFTFQNTLGAQYNIPQSKISVETSTDLNADIRVAWQTDATTKDFIEASLTSREGIPASVILKPQNEDIIDQQIPAYINLADTRTLGKMNIEPIAWRSKNWRNTTPYPLKLKYLHVLKKEISGTKPIIYSWSMNDAIVPPQAQVAFDHARVPAWLDNEESTVMWLDYSVEDCATCDKKVMDAVTGGVSGSRSQQIKFTIAPAVFDTLNAAYFTITVRSMQVDPKGAELKELPGLKIMKNADKEFSTGPLFIPSGSTPDFEYKITVATNDSEFYPSNQWIKASELEVLLGKTKMKDIFKGIVPGIN